MPPPTATTAAILLGALATGCSLSAPPPTPGRPVETFHAGIVFNAETPVLVHEFLVRNTTGVPVTVLDESHSCGCSTIELERTTLAPGQARPQRLQVNRVAAQ